jgi:hypothetical protein
MCRAKPYPRCSSYAKKALERALNAKKQDKERIKKAKRAYNITPAGIQEFVDAGNMREAEKYRRIRNSYIAIAKREAEVTSSLKYEPFKVDYDPFMKSVSKDVHLALDALSANLEGTEIIKKRKEQHERSLAAIEEKYKKDIQGKTPQEVMQLKIQRHSDRAKAQTNWRQMEWLGFEFENAIQDIPGNKVIQWDGPVYSYPNPGKKTSKISIDAWIVNDKGEKKPLDAKFHAWENSKGEPNYDVPLNDARAIRDCIEEHGVFYLLVAKADCQYDRDGSFKEWTYKLSGKKPSSSAGNSRIRKTGAKVREYSVYAITKEHLPAEDGTTPQDGKPRLKYFSQGKQQSGAARAIKYSLNIGKNGLIPIMKFTTPHGQQ